MGEEPMKIIITVLLMTMMGSGYAQTYPIYGAGTNSCGTWLEDSKTQPRWYQTRQWVSAWVTVYGYYSKDEWALVKNTDLNSKISYIDNYCAEKPDHLVRDGI